MGRLRLKGVPISPGIAIGILRAATDAHICEQRKIAPSEIASEIAALHAASAEAQNGLEAIANALPSQLDQYREIITAQVEMARDPRIVENAAARIRHKHICAAWAISDTIDELSGLFHDLDDPYLRARAEDIRAIGKCIIEALGGSIAASRDQHPHILAAYEISPADLLETPPGATLGLLTVNGGVTSHIAILARGLKIPAVAGLANLPRVAKNGEMAIVNGLRGEAILDPDIAELAHYRALQKKYATFEKDARQSAFAPAITRNDIAIKIHANLDRPQELGELGASGADGIGLYRTEFSYLEAFKPTEEQLESEYASILERAEGQQVIFRTLDIGSDKLPRGGSMPQETNPALGLRGIRFCLARQDIFQGQLRAILRAGAGHNFALMLPMVTSLKEVRQTRSLIADITRQLAAEGARHAETVSLGVMVETPAAVLIASELAAECDFLSLGTNDLLHYLMAIDRNNRHVAYLHDPLHPAFLRAIQHVANAGRQHGKPVCVCGEIAADPLGLALLLGLGVTSYSAMPRFVPTMKHLIRKLDTRVCARIAQRAMDGEEPEITRQLLRNILSRCMDSDLVYPTCPISTGQSA